MFIPLFLSLSLSSGGVATSADNGRDAVYVVSAGDGARVPPARETWGGSAETARNRSGNNSIAVSFFVLFRVTFSFLSILLT